MSKAAFTVSLYYKIQIREAQHSSKHSHLTKKQHSHTEQDQKKSADSDTALFWMTEFSNSREAHEKSEWENHFNQAEHSEHSEWNSDYFNNDWKLSSDADFRDKQKQCRATEISRSCWKIE